MYSKRIPGYIHDHWRGNHSLAFSFWFSFALLNVIIHYLELLVTLSFSASSRTHLYITVIYFVCFRFVVYPWQAIGVLRACERALTEYRNFVWVRSAQAIVVLGIIAIFVEGLSLIRVSASLFAVVESSVDEKSYLLILEDNDRTIRLSGSIDFGITRDLAGLLEDHADVERIILDSKGGPVSEGRGLAFLIGEKELHTYSLRGCSSACTIAFIGGKKRLLGPEAKLGFHHYRLDSKNVLPFLDLDNEFKKDLAFYASQSIDTAFLDKMYEVRHSDMWFPSHEELLQAGVIDGVVSPDKLAPSALSPTVPQDAYR